MTSQPMDVLEKGLTPNNVTVELSMAVPNEKDVPDSFLEKAPSGLLKLFGKKGQNELIALLLLVVISISGLISMLKVVYGTQNLESYSAMSYQSLHNYTDINATAKVF